SAENRAAVAAPMPEPAPVTMTTFPSKRRMPSPFANRSDHRVNGIKGSILETLLTSLRVAQHLSQGRRCGKPCSMRRREDGVAMRTQLRGVLALFARRFRAFSI